LSVRIPVVLPIIGVARGAQDAMPPAIFLAYIVISCFERRHPKQNTVTRLKSNILALQRIWAGFATAANAEIKYGYLVLPMQKLKHN